MSEGRCRDSRFEHPPSIDRPAATSESSSVELTSTRWGRLMKHPGLASFATTLLASAISLCVYPAHAPEPGGQTTTTRETDAAPGAAQPDNTQAAPAQSTSTSPQADQTNPQNAKRTGEEQ